MPIQTTIDGDGEYLDVEPDEPDRGISFREMLYAKTGNASIDGIARVAESAGVSKRRLARWLAGDSSALDGPGLAAVHYAITFDV